MTTIKKPIIGIAYSDSAQRDNEMRIRTYVSRKYYHAIQRAGGIAILLPAPYGDPALTEFEKECLNTEHATNYLNLVDGIVFAGGEDVAPRYQNEEPIPELDMVNPLKKKRVCWVFVEAYNSWPLPSVVKCIKTFLALKRCSTGKKAPAGTLPIKLQ